jgi:Ca-activated chloride channel family protein
MPTRISSNVSFRIVSVSAVVVLCAAAGFSADPVPPPGQARASITPRNSLRSSSPRTRPNLRYDVQMVLVPVTVTDTMDRPVMDLPVDSFRLLENNVEQKIVSLSTEDGPVSIGFLFDNSSSMRKRTDRSVKAIEQFLAGTDKGDEFFLVRFADRPDLITTFTNNPDEITKNLAAGEPQGWTALLDAICLGVQQMKHAKNSRRALVILTDGGDNNSRYTESEVRSLVRESDVRVYAIGLFERARFLERIAAETGGASFLAHRLEDLPEVVERLSRAFRNQYVLGYSSNNAVNDGKYRKVKVELKQAFQKKPMNIFWRRGYYAPPD